MTKNIILYGFAGTEKQYRVLSYYVIDKDIVSIDYLKYRASVMMELYPSITRVYAVDNHPTLKDDYLEAIKATTIERTYEFYDLVDRRGIRIY